MTRLLGLSLLALAWTSAPRLLFAQERGAGSLSGAAGAAGAPVSDAAALGEAIEALPVNARVLLIGAHPDDEDNRLVAWMSRGRRYEVAYLSLTRGDGGQNAIGNELGEALGVIRTEELLAARRVDRAAQYFTRAYDYGFSKSAEEAFRHWPHDTLLGDVVRVVRDFRPHVVIAVFTGTPRDGHGQHQASGIVAREAYDAAGDSVRFPRARFGAPWTPLKFYRNSTYQGHQGATLRYNSGEYDALLGRSYAEIASLSRWQHRSQAQGSLEPRGPVAGSLRREASRVNEATPADSEKTITDGFDAGYARVAGRLGCARANAAVDSLQAAFGALRRGTDLFNPSGAVEPLARIAELAGRIPPNAGVRECATRDPDAAATVATLRRRTSEALRIASGVALLANAPREEAIVGRETPVRVSVFNRGRTPLEVRGIRLEGDGVAGPVAAPGTTPWTVAPDSALVRDLTITSAEPTRPYWLGMAPTTDMYPVMRAVPAAWGLPEAVVTLRVGGRGEFDVAVPVTRRVADQVAGEINRPVAFVPAIAVTTDAAVQYARAGVALERTINVALRTADSAAREVRVSLVLPRGLTADSAARTVTLAGAGTVRTVSFTVRGRLPAGRHEIRATAQAGSDRITSGYHLIDYPHMRPQRLYREAVVAIEAIDVALPPRATIAYVQGVGDNSAPALRQLGFDVTMLDPERLGAERLARFTAIVVGPRAYEASAALVRQNAALLDYVRRGGTMVVQYGQGEMQGAGIMPFPITIGRPAARVTDEGSEVRIVDPSSRLLQWPNRIVPADFAGWLQDRTLYMPNSFAPEYRAPLSTNDPGEPANNGVVLQARYGEGVYIYTTLSFFRQLPNGVPGAARLFVNLLGAGAAGEPAGARP